MPVSADVESFVNSLAALMRSLIVAFSLCMISNNVLRMILFADAMLLARSFPFQPSPPTQEVCSAFRRVNLSSITHVITSGTVRRATQATGLLPLNVSSGCGWLRSAYAAWCARFKCRERLNCLFRNLPVHRFPLSSCWRPVYPSDRQTPLFMRVFRIWHPAV